MSLVYTYSFRQISEERYGELVVEEFYLEIISAFKGGRMRDGALIRRIRIGPRTGDITATVLGSFCPRRVGVRLVVSNMHPLQPKRAV